MRGQVHSWWLNALVITTVLWMWATLAVGIWVGITLVSPASDTKVFGDKKSVDCNYDNISKQWLNSNYENC